MNSGSQHPISEVTTVLEVVNSPQLSEIYATVLRLHRPTVGEVSAHVDCALSTVYRYVNRLKRDGLVKQIETQQPYRYEAADICIQINIPGAAYRIEPLLIVASARRTRETPLDEFVQQRGIEGLASALERAEKRVTTDSQRRKSEDTVDVPEPVIRELYDVVVEYKASHGVTNSIQENDCPDENPLV